MKTRKHKAENRQKKQFEISDQSFRDLEDLQHQELSGEENKEISTVTSSTDEDENEGLGDGNIGRSKNNILGK